MLTVTEDSQINIMVLIKQTLIRVLLMHIVVLAVHFSITTFSFFPDLTCFLQYRVGKKNAYRLDSHLTSTSIHVLL